MIIYDFSHKHVLTFPFFIREITKCKLNYLLLHLRVNGLTSVKARIYENRAAEICRGRTSINIDWRTFQETKNNEIGRKTEKRVKLRFYKIFHYHIPSPFRGNLKLNSKTRWPAKSMPLFVTSLETSFVLPPSPPSVECAKMIESTAGSAVTKTLRLPFTDETKLQLLRVD